LTSYIIFFVHNRFSDVLLWVVSARSCPDALDQKLFPTTQSLLLFVKHFGNSFEFRIEQSVHPIQFHQQQSLLQNLNGMVSLQSVDHNTLSRFIPLGLLQASSPISKRSMVLNMFGILIQSSNESDSSNVTRFQMAEIPHSVWNNSQSLKRIGTLCHANADRQKNYFKLLRYDKI
jgi:hypothetical protein